MDEYAISDNAYFIKKGHKRLFSDKGFELFDLRYYKIPMDNSCFFHSILLSHFVNFRQKKFSEEHKNRREFCTDFRREIADKLYEEVESPGKQPVLRYETLADGNIMSFAEHVDLFKLENLHAAISNPDYCVGQEVIELVTQVLRINIFFLDMDAEDVYVGVSNHYFNPEWSCVVLLYYLTPEDDSCIGHYNLCGLVRNGENNTIITHFSAKHKFIQFLLAREREILNGRIKK